MVLLPTLLFSQTTLLNEARKEWLLEAYEQGTDAELVRTCREVIAQANLILDLPPVEFKMIGPRLLQVSREAIYRIGHCSMAWTLTGKNSYLEKAISEMQAIASFHTWNPSHFLDVAEMSFAMAIGLDWLKEGIKEMQPGLWEELAGTLIKLGLKPGLTHYKSSNWWTTGRNNWCQVSNGGLTVGALAVKEYAPELATEIVRYAKESLPKILWIYEPDGFYPEGGCYWEYGTVYHVLMIDALLSNEEKIDSSLMSLPLLHSYESIIKGVDPYSLSYNFGDGILEVPFKHMSTPILWLASVNNDKKALKQLSVLEKGWQADKESDWNNARFYFLNPIYQTKAVIDSLRQTGENYKTQASAFEGSQTRETYGILADGGDLHSWDGTMPFFVWKKGDQNDQLFLAGKGGKANFSHASMDVGAFVLYKYGIRWVADLGRDNYNLPGYWDYTQGTGGRWRVYRHHVASQNLFRPTGKQQRVNAHAAFKVNVNEKPSVGDSISIDLTKVWRGSVKSYEREFKLLSQSELVVVDRFEKAKATPVWQIVTEATPEIVGDKMLLTKNGHSCSLSANLPGKWAVTPAKFPRAKVRGEGDNAGFVVVEYRVAKRSGELEINFSF